MVTPVNFTHLAAFYAVVQTGSVTAASERLHVSQSVLTREIRELEVHFGVPMFDRLPRGMHPTEAGRLLADFAAQIFSLADAAECAIGEFAEVKRGRVAITASRAIAVYLLPPVLNEFRRLYPGIEIDLSISNTEHVEEKVRVHERQIGLVEGLYDASVFDAVVIGHDELIAVASPAHPLARKRKLSAVALGGAELVLRVAGSGARTVVEQAFAKHAFELSPNLSVGSPEAIKRQLRHGRTVAWVSRY